MSHENVLDADRALLLICDLQEAFRPAIDRFDENQLVPNERDAYERVIAGEAVGV